MATAWPTAPIEVPPRVKYLITRFFDISDTIDADSGQSFANEVFAEDGFFKTHETCVFRGRDEIASCRKNISPLVVSRSHELVEVFAANSPATVLVVLGKFIIRLKDDSTLHLDFTARFDVSIAIPEADSRLQSVQVWTDSATTTAAYQRAAEAMRDH